MAEVPDVVLGQGSLGTLFAAQLAQQENPVHVVSRRAETREDIEIQAHGRGKTREATVQRSPKLPERARLVIVATRATDALERAREASAILAEDGLVVTLQNGLVPLTIADELGPSIVAPAVVGFNAHLDEEGTRAEITSPGPVTIGALDPQAQPGVEAFAEAVGPLVPVNVSDNPRGAIWSKWCVSCAINGLAVVAGEGVGTITQTRAGREALVSIVTECTRVAEACDIQLKRVAGPFAPDTLAGNASTGIGGAFRRGVTWLIGRRYSDVTPSSFEALEAGRDPELDTLNQQAVARGGELGVPTPWNAATLALAEEVQAGKREPAMANLDVLREQATGQDA